MSVAAKIEEVTSVPTANCESFQVTTIIRNRKDLIGAERGEIVWEIIGGKDFNKGSKREYSTGLIQEMKHKRLQ
jgi:hypothetical protein